MPLTCGLNCCFFMQCRAAAHIVMLGIGRQLWPTVIIQLGCHHCNDSCFTEAANAHWRVSCGGHLFFKLHWTVSVTSVKNNITHTHTRRWQNRKGIHVKQTASACRFLRCLLLMTQLLLALSFTGEREKGCYWWALILLLHNTNKPGMGVGGCLHKITRKGGQKVTVLHMVHN